MRYLIYTEALAPDWYWDPLAPTSGTSEFYVRTAQETVRMHPGNEVMVVYDGPLVMPEEFDDRLVFMPRDDCRQAIEEFDPDKTLVCNHDPVFTSRDVFGSVWFNVIFWTNRYEDEPEPVPGLCIVVSEFHRKQLASHGLNNYVVVPHGVDHAKYDCDPKEKAKICLFSSSYDRGGSYLENLWQRHRIVERTGYALHVTHYGRDAGMPGRPTGLVPDEEMVTLYKEAAFWLHPGQGVELFCLAGAKAQAAHCTPVIVPAMALAETVKWGFRFTEEEFGQGLIRILNAGIQATSNAEHIPSWSCATRMLWEVRDD